MSPTQFEQLKDYIDEKIAALVGMLMEKADRDDVTCKADKDDMKELRTDVREVRGLVIGSLVAVVVTLILFVVTVLLSLGSTGGALQHIGNLVATLKGCL